MKYLLVISFLFLFSCGESSDTFSDGEHLYYHENGQLKEKGNYKDGKKEGEWLSYHENGQLFTKENHKDGKEEGEYSWYY